MEECGHGFLSLVSAWKLKRFGAFSVEIFLMRNKSQRSVVSEMQVSNAQKMSKMGFEG